MRKVWGSEDRGSDFCLNKGYLFSCLGFLFVFFLRMVCRWGDFLKIPLGLADISLRGLVDCFFGNVFKVLAMIVLQKSIWSTRCPKDLWKIRQAKIWIFL